MRLIDQLFETKESKLPRSDELKMAITSSLEPFSIERIFKTKLKESSMLLQSSSTINILPNSMALSSPRSNTSQMHSAYHATVALRNRVDNFGELYLKRQEERETAIEKKEIDQMNENQKNQLTEKWADISESLKRSERTVSQEVASTMKVINQNISLVVNEQEKSKSIRDLTSLESIFKSARKDVITVSGIDLLQNPIIQSTSPPPLPPHTLSQLKPIRAVHAPHASEESVISWPESRLQTKFQDQSAASLVIEPNENLKFKRIKPSSMQIPRFDFMLSRFISKNQQPNFDQDSIRQKKRIIRPKLVVEHRGSLQEIKYKPFSSSNDLSIPLTLNRLKQPTLHLRSASVGQLLKQDISHDESDIHSISSPWSICLTQRTNNNNQPKSMRSSLRQSISDHNLSRSLHNGIGFNSQSMLGQAIDSVQESQNQQQFNENSSILTERRRRTTVHSVGSINKSKISKLSLPRLKLDELPRELKPYKDLVLNTWRGKVGPSKEESIVLSNCLGMLSLHTHMTANLPDIKEYVFSSARYTAVPSQSSRREYQTDKKFQKVAAAAALSDNKLQTISGNIQQLDQIIELEDPVDYLVKDYY